MLAKLIVSTFLFAAALTACGGDDKGTPDGCTGHACGGGSAAITDPEGGNIIFEYIYFDTELQAAFKLPAGTTTVNRVMAYFMNAQTPQSNPLPTAGTCNNLVATKGWPEWVAATHTDLDVGTLSMTGKNMAGADVTIDVPKMPKGTDAIGRAHDIFYQVINPGAAAYLQPNSSYTIKMGGAGSVPATTITNGLFLANDFQVNSPTLEENGPLVAGTDYTVHWTPATSSNLPPTTEEVGGGVLGVTWLVDTTGAPTHVCPADHASGQFKIPGAAITEYKAIATSRGLPANKMILLRNAVVHRLTVLPNGDAANKRRVDMLTLLCWAQLVDVQ
jgi:hypothetical protein